MALTQAPPRVGTDHPPTALLVRRVEDRLRRALDSERRWVVEDPDLAAPLDTLALAVLSGGKRLRPRFCALGYLATGAGPDDLAAGAVVDAGAALELLHAFALVHDDVMDDAALRRGRPTPHTQHATRHELAEGRGESRRFGESVAILVGDLAHTYAERLASGLPTTARAQWHELQVELMMGQYLDVLRTGMGRADDRQARRIARLKSGRYSIEHPLQLGATLGEAGGRVRSALADYGTPLGLAFQFRDDLLGAVGSTGATGKPVGADLREGKPTVLLATALERAGSAGRRLLDRAGAPDLGDAEVDAMRELLVHTGAVAHLEREIDRLTGRAVAALDGAPLPTEVAGTLVATAWALASREA